jgi:hypothetical protein
VIKLIETIIKGLSKLLAFIGTIVLIALVSYGLSYICEANTREIFLRIISIGSVLILLYNIGR